MPKVVKSEDLPDFIKELVGNVISDATDESEPPVPPNAVQVLKDMAAAYQNGCMFSPGDLVTPRKNVNVRGEGLPHVVLEVVPNPGLTPDENDDATNTAWGRRLDMRVLALNYNGRGWGYIPFWAESFTYEPWKEEDVNNSEPATKSS